MQVEPYLQMRDDILPNITNAGLSVVPDATTEYPRLSGSQSKGLSGALMS